MIIAGMNPEQTHLIHNAPRNSSPTFQRVPPFQDPIPPLLLDFAEAFVGHRLDEKGDQIEIPYADFEKIRSEILALPKDGSRVRHWLRWTATHPSQRKNSIPDF
jgi:hypothetical protein